MKHYKEKDSSDLIKRGLDKIIPGNRIRNSLIDILSYASDAGFYHLVPRVVVLPESEQEIAGLFDFSIKNNIPLVFRTGGTSLSGQSITDGILVDLSQNWNKISVSDNGGEVRAQPGITGAMVNAHLRKYSRKIGPDPASISAAMMGGIISNNASGMCCGVSNNSYHTLKHIRFILPSGKTYSTEVKEDHKRFVDENPELSKTIKEHRETIINTPAISKKIRQKYKTKNTVGYSVNAFIDYEEPLDIMAHLLVGAEGTLGFISEAVLHTIQDFPEKATAMLYFNNIYDACQAIVPLNESGAAAVELMDRASLRSIEHIKGVPGIIPTLSDQAVALLVEYQERTEESLKESVDHFHKISSQLLLIEYPQFTTIAEEQALLWKVRKGMFPSVGAVRASGTTVILEDIAFPVEVLGDAITDLQSLFKKYTYDNAIIFGHAKDGNIHFVVTQALDKEKEIQRYANFMQDVVNLVVKKYNGALKAEHGTGRNMAPFVETEWGTEIYNVMKSVKDIVDPHNILNPGVVINDNKNAHITHLKELPTVEEEVDKCIECGFCEHKCPSRNLTLTPRRRIVVRRELQKLRKKQHLPEYKTLLSQYQYHGLDTCAVDGLCATACPVDINTGDLVKRLRRESHSRLANNIALQTARHFKVVSAIVKAALQIGVGVNTVLGKKSMENLTKGIRKIIPASPLWSSQLAVAERIPKTEAKRKALLNNVVYFPSCISRVMGDVQEKQSASQKGTMNALINISKKAGIDVIIPETIKEFCCGQIYSSKGFSAAYYYMSNRTIEMLWESTREGTFPVVFDISSCTYTILNCRNILTIENKQKFDRLQLIDSIDYIHDYVMQKVAIRKKKQHIALHPVCSLQKIPGLGKKFAAIASHFSEHVTQPLHAGCCGMAGDRGFLFPGLTESATGAEAGEIVNTNAEGYYSSSKTCEIAMSDNTGKRYQSIIKLVEECLSEK